MKSTRPWTGGISPLHLGFEASLFKIVSKLLDEPEKKCFALCYLTKTNKRIRNVCMRKYLSAVFFYDRIHIPDDSAFGVATTAVDTLWFGLFQANVLTLSPAAAKASMLVSS